MPILVDKIEAKNQVTYLHDRYRALIPSLNFVSDIWQGKSAWMGDDLQIVNSEKAQLYLPPTAGELQDMRAKGGKKSECYYYNRLRRSLFPRFFRDAIEKDFAGLLSKFELLDALPSFTANVNNIDLLGNSLKVFLKEADELALRDGACFVFVENPPADPNLLTLRDELESDRRPYLIIIPRHNVINWWVYNNELVLIVIREEYSEPDGLFGSRAIAQYRVFRKEGGIVSCQIWQEGAEEGIYYVVDESIISLNHIPIVPYSLHTGNVWNNIDLPLKDLAEMNLSWYQLDSQIKEMIYYCQPTLIKEPEENNLDRFNAENMPNNDDVPVGARVCLEGKYSWLEPTGTGIKPAQDERAKIEEAIKAHSLAFLQGSELVKTATQSLIEAAQIQTNFELMSYFKESNTEVILRYWANWSNNDNGGKIEVNKQLISDGTTGNGKVLATDNQQQSSNTARGN